LKAIGKQFPPFPMVADPTFEIGRKYGVVDEEEGIEPTIENAGKI
jgi:alkyl hydroperoxide reductase subunit AhpC